MVSKATKFFLNGNPADNHWRGINLLGSNTQAFKFALAKNLLALAREGEESTTIENLAMPFALEICEHLKVEDRQGTNPTSTFLDACRRYNSGATDIDELSAVTTTQAFRYVFERFHYVSGEHTPTTFFNVEGTGNRRVLHLTQEMIQLAQGQQGANFDLEVDARWSLVESAWSLKLHPGMIYHNSLGEVVLLQQQTRRPVSGVKEAISGYQKGHCFHCHKPFSLEVGLRDQVHVDHFFPLSKNFLLNDAVDLDQIWNLVLSCYECNRDKRDLLPAINLVERLLMRSNYYINSNDPLKQTLQRITGITAPARRQFHLDIWKYLSSFGGKVWSPKFEDKPIL